MIENTPSYEQKIIKRTTLLTVFGNLFLALFKLIAGIFSLSQALISDAIDSLGDVLSAFIVMIGLKISSKKEDTDHPFGHERFESVATIILSIILLASGITLGYKALQSIFCFFKDNTIINDLSEYKLLGLISAIVSILGKEIMYWFTKSSGKKINSSALMASAWNYRIDTISSIGSCLSVLLAMLGVPIVDSFISALICVFIIYTSIKIFVTAINQLIDKACDETTEKEMRECILKIPGVLDIDTIKTRLFGSKIYVDLEISVDGNITVKEGHAIAEKVHDEIEKQFPSVKHCMVHVNPGIPII